jgi:hypothetical protein
MQNYGATEPAGRQAIGILNIVFGVLGVLGWGLLSLVTIVMVGLGGAVGIGSQGLGPLAAIIGGFGLVALVYLLGHAILSGMLISGGIGILNMRRDGRRKTLTYAWITVILHLIGLVFSAFHTTPAALRGAVNPVVLLVVLNQPDCKAAFPD